MLGHLKTGGKETRKFCIEFLGRLISQQWNPTYKRVVWELASELPFAPTSFIRSIYLELVDGLTTHVSTKLFWSTFLDAYYTLSKDKWSNVVIKFWTVSPNIYKKIRFEDSKNKERIINILRDNEKLKPFIREHAEKSYQDIMNMDSITVSMRSQAQEEEKKLIEHEKDIGEKDKFEVYKDHKLLSNGMKGYGMEYSKSSKWFLESKSTVPKSHSQAKFKKSLKKKKATKSGASRRTKINN